MGNRCSCRLCERHREVVKVIEYLDSYGKTIFSDTVKRLEKDADGAEFMLDGVRQSKNRDAAIKEIL